MSPTSLGDGRSYIYLSPTCACKLNHPLPSALKPSTPSFSLPTLPNPPSSPRPHLPVLRPRACHASPHLGPLRPVGQNPQPHALRPGLSGRWDDDATGSRALQPGSVPLRTSTCPGREGREGCGQRKHTGVEVRGGGGKTCRSGTCPGREGDAGDGKDGVGCGQCNCTGVEVRGGG